MFCIVAHVSERLLVNELACPFRDTTFSGCNSLSGVVGKLSSSYTSGLPHSGVVGRVSTQYFGRDMGKMRFDFG